MRSRRVALDNRAERSRKIQGATEQFLSIQEATHLMVYVGHRSEVQTDTLIDQLIADNKRLYVPWCENNELRLFRLESRDELQPGAFGIPEPKPELRTQADRIGSVEEMEVIVLPGISFDRLGRRLGQGKGYYDRLLKDVSQNCTLIGLAFDVQITDEIPSESHDVPVHVILSESEVLRCRSPHETG